MKRGLRGEGGAAGGDAGRRIVETGLLIMIVCLPISISGTQIGLGLAIAGGLYGLFRGRRPPRTPLDEPIVAFLLLSLLSSLASAEPVRALQALRSSWVILTLYLVVGWLGEPGRLERFLRLLIPPAVALGIYGIVQQFTGVDLLRPGGSGLSALALGGRTVYFPRGGFSHYQTFANVFFLVFCLVLALATGRRERAVRFARGAAALFLALVVVFTFTRGIWVALLAALTLFAWNFARRAALALTAGAAVLILALLFLSPAVRNRALSMADPGTNVERLLLWETTWNMVRDHPLLGVGVGNYRAAQDAYVRDEVPMRMTRTHAHNVWLQIAVERGLLGLIAFVWLAGAVMRESIGALARTRPGGGLPFALAAGALAGIVGFFLDGLVQNNFGDAQVATLFWLVAGVALVCGSAGVRPGGPAVEVA